MGSRRNSWCSEYRSFGSVPTGAPQPGAGIVPKVEGWSPAVTVVGTLLGVLLLLTVIALVLPLALILTLLEALRDLLNLDAPPAAGREGEEQDSHLTLVLPGTCSYAFWQIGMVQYLCEHFDTSNLKLAGVSSGAISATLLLHLEEVAAEAAAAEPSRPGGAARDAVRGRAKELFGLVEGSIDLRWPLSFIGRLRTMLDATVGHVIPKGAGLEAASSRLRVGVRKLAVGILPAMVPGVVDSFGSQKELREAVLASSNVWLVVSLAPWRLVPNLGAFCSDGVNPFSLYCFFDYARQLRSGEYKTTAPSHMHHGVLDRIYPIWNCTVMKAMLSPNDRHIWVSPTVGGRLKITNLLRFSTWFIGHQWQEGYAHARDLDAAGYWSSLRRRQGI